MTSRLALRHGLLATGLRRPPTPGDRRGGVDRARPWRRRAGSRHHRWDGVSVTDRRRRGPRDADPRRRRRRSLPRHRLRGAAARRRARRDRRRAGAGVAGTVAAPDPRDRRHGLSHEGSRPVSGLQRSGGVALCADRCPRRGLAARARDPRGRLSLPRGPVPVRKRGLRGQSGAVHVGDTGAPTFSAPAAPLLRPIPGRRPPATTSRAIARGRGPWVRFLTRARVRELHGRHRAYNPHSAAP